MASILRLSDKKRSLDKQDEKNISGCNKTPEALPRQAIQGIENFTERLRTVTH
jgi:hypothetical protein